MAGSDYGNVNNAIDAIMSNRILKSRIKVSTAIALAPPSPPSIHVDFDISSERNVVAIDATLKPHIITIQTKLKEGLKKIQSDVASKMRDALPIKHADDDPELGERTVLSLI
jgi:hypothetical protein